jgi:hypothetical protein
MRVLSFVGCLSGLACIIGLAFFPPSMIRKILLAGAAAVLAAACASHTPDPNTEPEAVNVRIAGIDAPIKAGDCVEAVRRAVANPAIDVEKVPAPVSMNPLPVDVRKMPKGVADKNGYYQVKFQVLVDTLGKPDMKTFTVVNASNSWLGTSVKRAVAKWKFSPAQLAGCKVPRNYSLGISPRGRSAAGKSTSTKKPPK